MVSVEVLQQIVIYSVIWNTVTTVIILLARRDVKLGITKWFFLKTRKSPIKLRFHGADKTVDEQIITTKGKGDVVTINDKKLLFIKTDQGSTFMLDEEAIRRGDDGINEISYNYKSIMPIYPHLTEEEAEKKRTDVIRRIEKKKKEAEKVNVAAGVQMENLAQYTDPKRLNRLIEYIKLAAKVEAQQKATDMEKYVKFAFYAAAASAVLGVIIWYTMSDQVIPQLASIKSAVESVGSRVLNL